jgi:predicted permease
MTRLPDQKERVLFKAQYGLQGSITQIGVVTSGVPTSIQRQILATHKEPCLIVPSVVSSEVTLSTLRPDF